MSNKTDCTERVACKHDSGGCTCEPKREHEPCPPGADDNCTIPTSDGGAAIPPWHDNGACLVPPECEACLVGDAERNLRTELAELKRRLDFLESVGDENGGWCEHERRYQRTSGGDGDHCYICERDELKARVARRKTDEKKERHDEAD